MTQNNVEKWGTYEITLKGKAEGNPFTDVEIKAVFTSEAGDSFEVEGFYDGEDTFKIRFMPNRTGLWKYEVRSDIKDLDGMKGEFLCVDPSEGNHGPVRVCNTYHFCYEDGTPYHPFGTTLYAWVHQREELIQQTLESLRNSPFNKVRMCVFPKYYAYNREEPPMLPMSWREEDGRYQVEFNVKFFQHFERLVKELMDMGIEADVILFHPYDKWGFCSMPEEVDKAYLRYLIARISSYRNVWWSMANEYDLIKPQKDWDGYFHFIVEKDPYNHLRSVHQCFKFYDHTKPWITHASIQWQGSLRSWSGEPEIDIGINLIPKWREMYKKPVIIDECGYEGNIEYGWGNLPPQEMMNRFWEGVTSGGYVTHGETYYSEDEVLWWSKGGRLKGESPKRIAFLRTIIEEAPPFLKPIKLDPMMDWDVHCIGKEGEYYLIYFDINRPVKRTLKLPEGKYRVDLVDCWETEIHSLGIFQGQVVIRLPGKSYVALRIQKMENNDDWIILREDAKL
ncbi:MULTISPECIES: DUF5605 domain-containing protein [Thermotoga]|nr:MULTISPECIES: DUF5605 domain-containing protein [Thermotoga]AGL49877.1 hypothetical protein Tmari_0952 [Thermotoga maritima MSB8]AHD19136.1 hypothetical protein THEMA_09595 [Thermotoga maritima MSB8]KFZ21404.1 hypothetical protein LA10_08614 [Thermotoga neapolitana LA10]KHC90891.1 hypothetical protein Mc24_06723 [Thermotoga sp. Mc24]